MAHLQLYRVMEHLPQVQDMVLHRPLLVLPLVWHHPHQVELQ
jgi:hypothetical protein